MGRGKKKKKLNQAFLSKHIKRTRPETQIQFCSYVYSFISQSLYHAQVYLSLPVFLLQKKEDVYTTP